MGRIPDGRGMSFEPRSVVFEHKAFGRVRGELTPAEGVDPRSHRFRAAMMQHHLACAVFEGLLRDGLSVAEFALRWDQEPGLSADRQRRILRGETAAQFADIAFWSDYYPEVADVVAGYIQSLTLPSAAGSGGPMIDETTSQPGT